MFRLIQKGSDSVDALLQVTAIPITPPLVAESVTRLGRFVKKPNKKALEVNLRLVDERIRFHSLWVI